MNKKIVFAIVSVMGFSMANVHAAVKIKGDNKQEVKIQGAVTNSALGSNAVALQNLSSNRGNVEIGGNNVQTTVVQGAVLNTAVGNGTKAEQNLASNVGN